MSSDFRNISILRNKLHLCDVTEKYYGAVVWFMVVLASNEQ